MRYSATFAASLLYLCLLTFTAFAADEYTGQFSPELEPDRDNLDKVVFQPTNGQLNFKLPAGIDEGANVTSAFLYNPSNEKLEVPALLIEPQGDAPYLWVDANLNKAFEAEEKFSLQREEDGNPYVWHSVIKIPLNKGSFKIFPLYVQFYRNVKWDEMSDQDRLVLQSSEVYARGYVDIQGKKTLVAYSYNPRERRISLQRSQIGIDCDGNNAIDWGRFSGEAAVADDDTVIFRVGEVYVSNKRADIDKNIIILRSHNASDYKRIELKVGDIFPQFEFKDFAGKKRSLAEFRGKYVLLDFWAIWCGPCRREMPYQKTAYQRYNARGFEILGLNADEADYISQVKNWLDKNKLDWTQASRESIQPLMRSLRIHLYPTTLLIDPEGKIISLDERKKDQPGLRGQELLKSLQNIFFPPAANNRPTVRNNNSASNSGAGNASASNGGKASGSNTFGNIRLSDPPAGFKWQAAEKVQLFCAVPENWSFKEEATNEGVKIQIAEPSADGNVVVTSDVQTKVTGSAVEKGAALFERLTKNKQVVGQNSQQFGDQSQMMCVIQENNRLTFHLIVTNTKTNSLRVSQFTCPIERMNEISQKAQTVMNTMLLFELR